MADTQQSAPIQQRMALPAKKTFVARLAASVASHAFMSLAIIILLLILVIGLYVYYHGFMFLGPYAKDRAGFRGAKRRSKGADGAAPEDAGDEKGDPETERLIDTINRG